MASSADGEMDRNLLAATLALGLTIIGCASHCPEQGRAAAPSDAIVIGRTFVMTSAVLGEARRITVYLPPEYEKNSRRYPVLYLLDGGAAEDFHHITGIIQVSVANQIIDPVIVIGIENTERRRDLTGPTQNAEDKTIAPRVGGSAAFRAFVKNELIPRVERDFRGNGERGIIGESLAGLFVLETFFEDPGLFDRYIAVSPSLWWNDGFLLRQAKERLRTLPARGKTLYLTAGDDQDNSKEVQQLADILSRHAPPGLVWHHMPLPKEQHHTIFHIGALNGLRLLYAVKPQAKGAAPTASPP
jgi:predicted alpha/beta superfamily hydrolase